MTVIGWLPDAGVLLLHRGRNLWSLPKEARGEGSKSNDGKGESS